MDVFRRLLDFLTLGSERPIRRLLAYYVVLGVVVAALFHFVPLLNDLVSGTHLEKLTGSSNLLEDGLAGLSAPVPTQAETTIDLILTTMIVMISALVLMLPVAWVFMSARNVRSFDQGVVQTLIILPLVVAGIVLVVRTSLALAFSLGAIVAGIRFRTNVRDVRDTVYIFLGIGVGLAVGVQSLVVAAMLSITFNFVVLFIWRYDFGRSVLEPTASSQWAQPLENLSERESEHSVPDRDLVLALSPRRAAELAKRFDRVQRILGPAKKGPRFNSILSVTTTSMGEAQNRIESVLNTYARRWRLDQVTTTEGKPGELYYLVGMRRSVTRDALMTAIREVAGDKIVSANLEMSDAVGQEKGKDKAVEKAQEEGGCVVNRPSIGLLLLGLLSIGLGCEQTRSVDRVAADSLLVTQRLARFEKAVTHPDSGDKDSPVALWKLPEALRETSGLTLTADGRLLTHGDEHGKIFEIDYRRGKVVKSFTVGSPAVKGDFEAITRVGDTLWLATMSGKLFRFMEGADEAPVSYDRVDTGLGNSCEFEAMTYEASSNSLLLVCKQVFEKPLKDFLVIFRVPLTPAKNGKEVPPTRLEVPLAKVIGNNPWKEFHPSDIAIDPASGNYVIVASIEKALLELTPAGEVKWSRPLPKGHDQAEGIAISPDHILFISDEANKGPARLTLYRWP